MVLASDHIGGTRLGEPMGRLGRILLVVLVASATAACTVRIGRVDSGDVESGCGAVPDGDMSAEARAYLEAVNASNVRRAELDRKLAAQGDYVRREDVETQLSIERAYAPSLAQIPFTGKAVAPANDLRQAVGHYIAVLEAMLNEPNLGGPSHSVEVERIWDRRTAASRDLRRALGLPPSTCSFRHP
jgi:hypothetical protein